MTQFIVARNSDGLIMAADSKGFDFDLDGTMQEVNINPLIHLTSHNVILAGGDADAVPIAQSLAHFIAEEGLNSISDIAMAALPFLSSEYEKAMRKKCNCIPVDPVQHMYFILGGMNWEQKPVYQLDLIWNRKKLPQLDREEITTAFSVPRLISLEYTLATKISEGTSLDNISSIITSKMHKLQQSDDSLISPPLHVATITSQGVREETV